MADESESSSSEDEEYLLRLVKNASASGSRSAARTTSSTLTAKTDTELNTLNLARQSRQEKQAKRDEATRKALQSFTLQNLEAAKSIEVKKDQDQDTADTKPLEEVELVDTSSEPEKQFVAAFQSGQSSRDKGDFDAALTFFDRAEKVAASTSVKPQWIAALHASKANVLFASGRVREAIASNVEALTFIAPGDAKTKLQILKQLQSAYSDIGRLKDAEECQTQIDLLQRRRSQPMVKNPPTSSGKPIPEALKAALDQALESSINGQFGEMRALLSAYQDTRGGVGLPDIVNYQHSKTRASALMCAAARGETRLLHSLLVAGADLTLTAKDDSSALEWACKFNQPSAVSVLIQAGARLSPEFDWEDCTVEVKALLQQHNVQPFPTQQPKEVNTAQRTATSKEAIEMMTNRIKDLLQQPKST